MNERHLYRGKRLDNGEWITGGHTWEDESGRSAIQPPSFMLFLSVSVEVDPKTVAQCTGLCDKNGMLIFEGDILQWHRADIKDPEILAGTVAWRSDQWHVIYDLELERWWVLSAVVDRGCEVIGNIY